MQMEPCGVVLKKRQVILVLRPLSLELLVWVCACPSVGRNMGQGGGGALWLKAVVRGQWVDRILSGELWDSGVRVCSQEGDYHFLAKPARGQEAGQRC